MFREKNQGMLKPDETRIRTDDFRPFIPPTSAMQPNRTRRTAFPVCYSFLSRAYPLHRGAFYISAAGILISAAEMAVSNFEILVSAFEMNVSNFEMKIAAAEMKFA